KRTSLLAMIGIDLGTTNSLVAIMRDGQPVTLKNELGEDLIPSVVAVAEDGTLLVGRAAKDRLVTSPKAGQACFKRDMGTDTSYEFGGRKWSPVECSALVLRELKRIAEVQLQTPVDSAVITVPAYFHDLQRQATIDAAAIAGLKVLRLLNEPTSAALAYGYRASEDLSTLLVFDLGGGTFDVTPLMSRCSNRLKGWWKSKPPRARAGWAEKITPMPLPNGSSASLSGIRLLRMPCAGERRWNFSSASCQSRPAPRSRCMARKHRSRGMISLLPRPPSRHAFDPWCAARCVTPG
ncbi:MAG: hypothetical protein B7Z47_05085, partial [Chthoniobacter sp. 12-60-6]